MWRVSRRERAWLVFETGNVMAKEKAGEHTPAFSGGNFRQQQRSMFRLDRAKSPLYCPSSLPCSPSSPGLSFRPPRAVAGPVPPRSSDCGCSGCSSWYGSCSINHPRFWWFPANQFEFLRRDLAVQVWIFRLSRLEFLLGQV